MTPTARVSRAACAVAAAGLLALGPGAGARASDSSGAPAAEGASAVDLGGTAVPDTSTDPAAPVPLEAGLWSDTLAASTQEAPHQLVYRRTMADSQVHVGVTAAPGDLDDTAQLELATVAPDGTECDSVTVSSSYGDPTPFGGAVVVGGSEPGERGTVCGDAAEVRIELGRGSTDGDDLPVAIRVVEEAPASVGDPAALETTAEDPPASPPDPGAGAPTTVAGSSSFLDAPVLADGTSTETVTDTVATGEVALYRVRLGRGQSLAVGVEVPFKDAAARQVLESFQDPSVDLALVDPARAVTSGVLDDAVTSTAYADRGDDVETLVDGVPPVSWLRGYEGDPGSLPGDYWVALSVGGIDDVEPVEVPVELTVAVTDDSGPVGPGDPAYPEVVTGPGGTAAPPGYAAATPFLVGPGEFAAAVPADAAAPLPGDGGSSGRPLARTVGGAALGVAGVACLAGSVVLLRRRRALG